MTQQQWLPKKYTAHVVFPILQGLVVVSGYFYSLKKQKHLTGIIYYFKDWLPQIHQSS